MIEKEEQIVIGVMIQVLKPVTVRSRYKTIFHGQTNLKSGNFVWWYPIKNIEYSRLINEVSRWYKGKIKVNFGLAGTVEV